MPKQQLTAIPSWGDGHEQDANLAVGFYDHGLPKTFCTSTRNRRGYMQKDEFMRASCGHVQHLKSTSHTLGSTSHTIGSTSHTLGSTSHTIGRLRGRDQRWRGEMIPSSQDVAA